MVIHKMDAGVRHGTRYSKILRTSVKWRTIPGGQEVRHTNDTCIIQNNIIVQNNIVQFNHTKVYTSHNMQHYHIKMESQIYKTKK